MIRRLALLCTIPTILGIGCVDRTASAPPLAEQLNAPIADLHRLLDDVRGAEVPPSLEELLRSQEQAVALASESSDPLVKLYRMREPFIVLHSLAYFTSHQDDVDGLDDLEGLWETAPPPGPSRLPALGNRLQRALIEAAENKSRILHQASLTYGRIASPRSGLYYLGQSVGQARFASLVRSLRMGDTLSTEPELNESAISRGIQEVERITLEVFEQDPTSLAAVPASARLKEARELLDRGAIEGAALVLLESRLTAERELPALWAEDGPNDDAVLSRDSIGALFSRLAGEDEEGEAIRRVILPFYELLLTDDAEPDEAASAEPVVVTLVRWPYT